MSTHKLRTSGTKVATPTLSLAETLTAAGITSFEDAKIAPMMKAVTYQIHPETPVAELEESIRNGATLFYDEWTIFDYGTYGTDTEYQRKYGGPPPAAIVKKVGRIREVVPDADVVVYCVPEDPFVRVIRGDEMCWIGAWSRFGGFCLC
jgi:hypothetical protein